MRRFVPVLLCCLPAVTYAQVGPDWSFYPGFFSPGANGIVTANLDGVGNPETVVTGNSVNSFSYVPHLATLEQRGSGFVTTQMLALAPGWSFTGSLQVMREKPANVDRVVVSLRESNSSQSVIVTFGGKPLREMRRSAVPTEFSLLQLGDIDGDGQLEALGYNNGPAMLLDYATGIVEWTDTGLSGFMGAGQLDDDPALELVLGSQSGSTVGPGRILDGATRTLQWSYPDGFRGTPVFGNFRGTADEREFAIVERWGITRIFVSQPIFSPVTEINSGEVGAHTVRDVDNDGYAEIVIGEGQWGSVAAYSTLTGQSVFRWPNGDHGVSAIAIANLDGQNGLELVYGAGLTHSGRDVLKVIDTATGMLRYEAADEAGPHSPVMRVDIEGNGADELVFVTRQSNSGYSGGNLIVLNAATGDELRRRASALDSGFTSGVHSLEAIDIEGDGVQEIVGASGTGVAVLDGVTLADRWRVANLPAAVQKMGLMRFNGDAINDIVLALTNRLVVLSGLNGNELFRSVSFTAGSETGLAIGNADADAQAEIAFSVGANVYILDPTLGLVESFFTADQPVLGVRFEMFGSQCRITVTLSDRLDRRDCASGVSMSTRPLGMTALHVSFASDSLGDLVVSDGTRVHRIHGSTVVASSVAFGTSLGFRNLGEVEQVGDDLWVYIGGDQGVSRIRLPLEISLFASGFDEF